MWLPAEIVTPPTGVWCALAAAKTYLRADEGDAEDATIEDLVAAAGGHVEAYTATRLLTQSVKLRASGFDALCALPIGPVRSVTSVEYLAPAGTLTTLDPSLWESFGAGLEVGVRPAVNQQWPATRRAADAVQVTVSVGYGAAADMPGPVRQACLLLLGDFYMNREDTIAERGVVPATLPNGVDALLSNFRIY